MTTNRYTNGKIYKLVNDVDDEIYVGSTCLPLHKRLYKHKNDAKNSKRPLPAYNHLNSIGWDTIKIVLIQQFPCSNKMELERQERKWIDDLKPTLNKRIPTRSKQEYYDANFEQIKIYKQTWQKENRERLSAKSKVYRETNRDILLQKKKAYYEANKDKHIENCKKWTEDNNEKVKEYKKEWQKANQDKINARRKELRAMKKQQSNQENFVASEHQPLSSF